jgi:hypothetical protein
VDEVTGISRFVTIPEYVTPENMNIFTCLPRVALTCIAFASAAVSLSAFEGKVTMKMTAGKGEKEMPMTYYIKGTKIRTETVMTDKHEKETMTAVAIIDGEKREMIMLMMEQKTYMVHKMPEPKAQEGKDADQPEFKPTGRKEVIAGMEAEEYVSTSKKHVTELWVTKELGQMMMANQGKGGPGGKGGKGGAWQKFAEQNNLFALRVVERPKADSPEEMRMEVVKIEKGPQPDSLFVPPADFKQFEMPSMGDMMRGMIPGR